ncbi:diacylglycerol kinase 4-like [Amaranthus tricolor]|uniref:diacylglycerol kinase 4-like n=1 Tax=Amaranthus tricolor TaxID=29722 RepID=UPI0025841B3E|nr:diacylglycerol kinase 4-like [Amaranthus tricolor]
MAQTTISVVGGRTGEESNRTSVSSARSSVIDSLRGCGLLGIRIDKEILRRKILIPQYLRLAMRRAINSKDVNGGVDSANLLEAEEVGVTPEAPIVVFINSRSGGRHGPELMLRLQHLISEEQVFDLSDVKPNEFVQYGLACLEQLAGLGDVCAKEVREKLRVVVAGGDGTVGWVLVSLGELNKQDRNPIPPVAVIPLGTGNDLSRSFGWGGSFPFAWKSAVKRSLLKASSGPICRLDGWHVSITMPAGEAMKLPHSLKSTGECTLDQDILLGGQLPEKKSCYDGVFYNYFSIGMDAQVAYGFHNLRNEKPNRAKGPVVNKMIYSSYSCTQGWFFTPCASDPGLRGLNNILRIHIKKVNCSEWEQVRVPPNVRSIVALNLHNYASGRNPWGNLRPEYMQKRGFVEANADDGLLEIFGLKHGWHASFVMVELILAKHIAQAASIRFEVRGGQWRRSFMQMDGEPWKQPLDKEYSTFVEIKRVPFQSLMIRGE